MHNGFGYDCGAVIGAKLSVGFSALQKKLTKAKRALTVSHLGQFLVLIKCRKFQWSWKAAMNYSRCWLLLF
jgi:hypothetical protein